MKLNHGLHLAYCTNIHRGESWAETFTALKTYTLPVKRRICGDNPYAIGLRLSNLAARQLSESATLVEFHRWLDENQCYIFTINGFPFGQFHGSRVKEQVYLPDWTSSERLAYTNLLVDLLAQLMPGDVEGSVSTVPCGFKELVTTPEAMKRIRENLWQCVEHIARVSEKTGRQLHLGLEPEPLCLLESSGETIEFMNRLRAEYNDDARLKEHLGVNYDACHLAVEFENPSDALASFQQQGIRISKFHLSSALKIRPTPEALEAIGRFVEGVYLHQVIVRRTDGQRIAYRDLEDALALEPVAQPVEAGASPASEWRIHFHIPLHSLPTTTLGNTTDHLLGILDQLQHKPGLCSHLEMETYTWEVLPSELRNRDVVDQLVAEYDWTLAQLAERGLWNSP